MSGMNEMGIIKYFISFIFLSIGCNYKTSTEPITTISKPNIVFAIADDQSYPHAGIYGFPEVNTPGFDYVAKNGVLFQNAFVAAPQCSPSRAAILTGRNIWQLEEAGTHASSFPKKYEVFTNALEKIGYKVGFTGKPWGPGNWEIGGWKRNPVGEEYNQRRLQSVPASGINDRDYFGNFHEFLEDRKSEEPFFFWYGGHEPHRVYEYGSGVASKKTIDPHIVPDFLPNNEVTQNDVLDYLLEIEYFDSHLLKMINLLEEIDELQNTIIVVTADNGMPFPFAKANLQEFGTHVPLAISWEEGIKHSKSTEDLVSLIDLAPTFLEIVGAGVSPNMTGNSISELLFSEKESIGIRDFVLTGRERHTHARPDNLAYPARAIRTKEFLYIKNYFTDRWPMGDPVPKNSENDVRATVEGFKDLYPGYHDIDNSPSKTYFLEHGKTENLQTLFINAFEKRPGEQLYDIKEDPFCIVDLARHSDYIEIKTELRSMLDQALTNQGDPRMLGSNVFDSYPRYSPMRNFEGFNSKGEYNSAYEN